MNRFHSRDLRKGRRSEPGRAYLVTTTTFQRQPLFRDLSLGRQVVRTMRELHEKKYVDSLAFVIMPDHLHWLLILGERIVLSSVVNVLKSQAARNIRAVRPDTTIWQRSFHDRALRREEDIRVIARYIVANPLRAGLVNDIADYSLWDATWL